MNRFHSFVVETALLPVKFYRKYISRGMRQGKCKYLPTCSEYALQAFREWGIFIGFFLSLWRVLRCNPFSKGGYDPVPLRKKHRCGGIESPQDEEQ